MPAGLTEEAHLRSDRVIRSRVRTGAGRKSSASSSSSGIRRLGRGTRRFLLPLPSGASELGGRVLRPRQEQAHRTLGHELRLTSVASAEAREFHRTSLRAELGEAPLAFATSPGGLLGFGRAVEPCLAALAPPGPPTPPSPPPVGSTSAGSSVMGGSASREVPVSPLAYRPSAELAWPLSACHRRSICTLTLDGSPALAHPVQAALLSSSMLAAPGFRRVATMLLLPMNPSLTHRDR